MSNFLALLSVSLAPLALLGAALFFVYFLLKFILCPRREPFDFAGKHVFVTGGSKGIGRSLAIESARRGAKVSICARNGPSLKSAAELIDKAYFGSGEQEKSAKNGCQWYVCDVTAGYEVIDATIRKAENNFGPVDVLINNAGATGFQGRLEDMPTSNMQKVFALNVCSALHFTRAVLHSMKLRNTGKIAFVSSAAGQIGIWGYSAYSASKFAIRGMAEALQMECDPYGIDCTVIYPPNTMTEGFQEEMRTMPAEVDAISGTAGLFDSKDVANGALDAIENGDFAVTYGIDGWMLGMTCAGAAPEPNVRAAMQQIFLSGLLRLFLKGKVVWSLGEKLCVF